MIRRFDGFDIDHFQLGSLTSVHNKWDFFWYSNKCCKVESSALLTVAIFSMSKQFSPFPAQYWDQLSSKVFSSSSHKDYLQIENRLLLWIIHYFHHHELHITILFTKMKRERELFLSSPSSLFCVSISFNFASELKLLFDVFHPCFFVGCLSKSYRVAAALHKSKISQANFSSLFYTRLKLSAKYFFFISIQTLSLLFDSWANFEKTHRNHT